MGRANGARDPVRTGLLVLTAGAVSGAAWLLLVPLTVVYTVAEERTEPYDVSTVYSWSSSDQYLVYSDTFEPGGPVHLVTGVRIDCGTLLTGGAHEPDRDPDGPRACAAIEGPRVGAASGLGVVAVATSVLAARRRGHRRPAPGTES